MNDRAAMVELLLRLERATHENAKAFVVVTTDTYTGDVMGSCGPFEQAEQALIESGRMDAEWRGQAENDIEANSLTYTVVPLWESTP